MFLIFLISSSRDAGPVLKPEMQAFFLLAYFIIPAFAFQWNGADRMEKCRKENEGRKERGGGALGSGQAVRGVCPSDAGISEHMIRSFVRFFCFFFSEYLLRLGKVSLSRIDFEGGLL
jgi:hypothetical protein